MNEKPTGRFRFRTQKVVFTSDELLVLQLEFTRDDGPPDHNGLPQYLGGVFWRDATVRDIGRGWLNDLTGSPP